MVRYAPEIPFPTYSHVPGQTPHPQKHLDGHSYAAIEYDGPALTTDSWQDNKAYLYGVDLFNYGYWWEVHEPWEGLWKMALKESRERIYLQGLIQTAAALLKRRMGNQRGVEKLSRQAREKLDQVGGGSALYMGLRVADFTEAMEDALASSDGVRTPLLRLLP